jgi:hypothetical protein
VPKGYSKASCHDFKAARSEASEVMAAEAQGRQIYGGLEMVGKYVETSLLCCSGRNVVGVPGVPEKQFAGEEKVGAMDWPNRHLIKIKVQFKDETILPDEAISIY